MQRISSHLIFAIILSMLSSTCYAVTEVYQCKEKGSVTFQSKPCQGMGQTVAEKLEQEQQAKERRLADIQEKERRYQERLKQQEKKPMTFKAFRMKLKSKIF